jgi:inorganic pyrophosphatase
MNIPASVYRVSIFHSVMSVNPCCVLIFLKGDNDPVDVVEIGSQSGKRGGVYKVKPLGVLAMIDDGELDWKVIAISVDDPKASMVNDVPDVEK